MSRPDGWYTRSVARRHASLQRASRLEYRTDLARVRAASARLADETALNGGRDCRCDMIGQWWDWRLQDRRGQRVPRLLGERPTTPGHLVQQHTESPDVAFCIGPPATKHFGRHIGQRSGDCRCQCRHRRVGGRIDGRGLKPPRDAEVQHLRAAVAGDDDVLRFEIAVHDPSVVGVRDRVGHLRAVADQVIVRKATRRIRPLNGCPSTNSITMNARSPASATSYTAQMCG